MKAQNVLGALLAVAAVGLGAQTYYLVQVRRQLDAAEARTAATAAPDVQQRAGGPAAALPRDLFADLDAADARMRELFDSFYARFDRDLGARHPLLDPSLVDDGDPFLLGGAGQLGPRVDLRDRGDHYELSVDLPGAERADVEVRAEHGMLIVAGSRTTAREEEQPGSYVRRERHFGRFERRLKLPADADPSTLQTEYENGVLRATIDKLDQERA